MAISPFQWGPGNQAMTPGQAKEARSVAAALAGSRARPAANGWEGLVQVANALSERGWRDEAAKAEAAGQSSVAQALAGLGPNSTFEDLSGVLANPWVTESPGASTIASALLQRNLDASDPMRQLDMAYKQAQIEKLNAEAAGGGGSEYFGSTLPWQDTEGNLQYYQLQKGEGLPQLPSGARWLEPTSTVNTGTAQTIVGRNTGGVQGAIPIENLEAAQDTAVGKGLGEQQVTGLESGRNAASNNAKLDILETTLEGAPQGMQGALVQAAGSIGIPMEGLDDVQAAQAIINQMVPLQRPPGSGTMSDADLALFKQSLPSIINQPGGNAKIISTLRAINDYTIEQTNIERAYINGEITRAEKDRRQSEIQNPLQNYAGRTGGGSGSQRTTPNGIEYSY